MIQNFALGVDLGWMEQLEMMGYRWIDENGNKTDLLAQIKQKGGNAVRLRIFVNPPKESFWTKKDGTECMLGFCDPQSVLRVSKRVKDAGLKLMLDFHYSDHFADPMYQDIPKEWENLNKEQLKEKVYEHTKDALTLFKDNGIIPEWVQVGNEINSGIMIPQGGFKENPGDLVEFLNAGYDAVKEVCPQTQVITHLAAVNLRKWCVPFLDNFIKNNGKTDVLGFSYYPYWAKTKIDGEELYGCLEEYAKQCDKPVMVVEVGGEDAKEDETYELLKVSIDAVERFGDKGLGVFYWEPEATREILPDQYPLCAARLVGEKTLQLTKALDAYKDSKNIIKK